MSAAAGLGPRQAAILAHLEAHPGLTANELARAFGLRAGLGQQLAVLEQRALVAGELVWNPDQGRQAGPAAGPLRAGRRASGAPGRGSAQER